MKSLTLEDLRPEPGKFFLRKFDREFTIRIPNLADDAWLQTAFNGIEGNPLQTPEGMCRLVFRLLADGDKEFFKAVESTTIDEDGNEVAVKSGGWKALMESVDGVSEKVLMAQALLSARGFSRPILDQIVEEELKKKASQENPSQKPAGETSSTSLPPNTDGTGTISGLSLGEKSASPSEKSGPGIVGPSQSKQLSMGSSSTTKRKDLPRPVLNSQQSKKK